ncbi:hypothetical protein [Rhizorhabdus dicambivorans]|uniref:Uncharacterized protein n=1 Tax=Rhizorhabdus dicambivorans TaxID=1850238 RepID=A0A2A4G3E6_9SPHN|nr:hypothetical protein [Rhizorhabdus dicambivorans]ATE65020.1 hypothetical protein CMV14_11895 [Rhizorhabdus dicambivorans]PCE44293.1 hypothetical protein COO09_01280 [Rhizorhabdus dicambivorans]
MCPRRRIILAAIATGLVACPPAPAATPEPLTQARAVRMVAREVDLARRGRMTDAEQALARRIAATRDGRARADLIEAFAIGLFAAAPTLEHAMTARAIDHFGRAIEAYRQALGRDDPEVATAMVRRAEVERLAHPDDPQRWADDAYQQAYRIRSARLGPTALTTLSTLIPMAELMVLPSRSRGDGATVEAAASLLRQVIEGASRSNDPGADRLRTAAFDGMQRLQAVYGGIAGPAQRTAASIQPCRERIGDDALVFSGQAEALEMLARRFRNVRLRLEPCGSALVFELSPGIDPGPVLDLLTDIAAGKIRGVHMGLAEIR